jgi:hypothetical protein
LTRITGLSNLTAIRCNVTISDNPMLPSCDIDALLGALELMCNCSGNDDLSGCE